MYEIELKAHVADWQGTATRLDGFAHYCGMVMKDDVYYALHGGPAARVRTETPLRAQDGHGMRGAVAAGAQRVFFTYKRKEMHASNGAAVEVNDELECELGNGAPLVAFLSDSGCTVVLEKHKRTERWRYGDVCIELCEVPPLGDFLELEVLADCDDAPTVADARARLLDVLSRAGIGHDQLEERYYRDMVRAAVADDLSTDGEQKSAYV